jgi:hypothetical protein
MWKDIGKAFMEAFDEQKYIDIWVYWWELDQDLLEEAGIYNHLGI